MSKIIKGVKKVFKKVVKVLKKVVPIILAAAAIYFTAGAALGVTAAWGTAAGAGTGIAAGITSSLGTGIIGSTVSGAVLSAGYGAAIGGVVSAAGGGSFSQGAKSGAITGAITGGALGAIKGISAAKQLASTPSGVKTFPLPDSPGYGLDTAGTFLDAAGNPIAAAEGSASVATAINAPPPPPPPPKPGFFAEGGWLERNPEIVGGAVKGVGQGLMAGAQGDADIDFLRERQRLTAANYAGTDPGRNYRDLAGSQPQKDRYDPSSYGSWEYQYDAGQGRIIKVPVGG